MITFMGFVLIPFGGYLLLKRIDYLVYTTIFFSLYTASSVLNIGGITLTPAYYFGVLFLMKYFIESFRNGFSNIRRINIFMVVFIILVTASLTMPIVLKNEGVVVLSPYAEMVEVKFRAYNISQYMYLLFCFIIYFFMKTYFYNNEEGINKSIKVLTKSGWSIALLSYYQIIAFILKLPYDELFRASDNGNIQTMNGFIRVYGVSIEPSMHAISVIFLLSFLLNKKKLTKKEVVLVLLLTISGILSLSTTFLIGIFLLILYIFKNNLILKRINRENLLKLKRIFFIGISFVLIMVMILTFFKDFELISILEKLNGEGVSGEERKGNMFYHIFIGLKYPLLGVGYGSVRSKDLFSTFLANIGIVSTTVFILYLCLINIRLKKIKGLRRVAAEKIRTALLISFFLEFISVPEPYYLFFWIFMAIAEVIISKEDNLELKKIEKGEGNENFNSDKSLLS